MAIARVDHPRRLSTPQNWDSPPDGFPNMRGSLLGVFRREFTVGADDVRIHAGPRFSFRLTSISRDRAMSAVPPQLSAEADYAWEVPRCFPRKASGRKRSISN
jgi:hypothetical protein